MSDGDTSQDVTDVSEQEASDQRPYEFRYDHGRMPFFMKVVWVAFLIFATSYVVLYLLTSLGEELGA